jgi:hypothetical protein
MNERDSELIRLLAHDLDLYLEQRIAYRKLVAAGQHRGVKPPERPKHRTARETPTAEHKTTSLPVSAAFFDPQVQQSTAAAARRGRIHRRMTGTIVR